jgi:hypothetical protein
MLPEPGFDKAARVESREIAMPDITSISAILSSIKAASDIAKLLKEADLSLEKAELRLKLADLISALADARIEIADVQEMLNHKESHIRELEQALKTQKSLTYEEPCYWLIEGNLREGPFCQNCYDKDRKLIRLQGYDNGYFDCKACNNNYTTRSFRQTQDRAIRNHDPYA